MEDDYRARVVAIICECMNAFDIIFESKLERGVDCQLSLDELLVILKNCLFMLRACQTSQLRHKFVLVPEDAFCVRRWPPTDVDIGFVSCSLAHIIDTKREPRYTECACTML